MFYEFRRQQQLDFPVYIGGLSSKMTAVYDRRANQTRRQWPRLQLMQDVAPFVLNGQTINDSPARPGRVYALSSGMMTPKTLSNIFARRLVDIANRDDVGDFGELAHVVPLCSCAADRAELGARQRVWANASALETAPSAL